jgi:hypothetical protein
MEARGGSRRTGPNGRVERVGFGGSEGEMKMGRAMKWAESHSNQGLNGILLNQIGKRFLNEI